ncbi:leucine-rich repeat domain-containing protein [Plantactinospora sonchi]|uniref:Leucine-rich repeat domain-containing protein n=1 Tax=Plantactinospora sonchi TaxID=1544735 RepID=A0ABU7RWF3_9ACTN
MIEESGTDRCRCFNQMRAPARGREVRFHAERQDTSAPGWRRLLELVDEAAADGREVFRPLADLPPAQRRQIVELPPTIARLTEVRHLQLYGSNLVRIPPEIGAMTSLEEFTPYTSYRLHWFPYELTRCRNLRRSTVSTRALYGNYKYRAPFPRLRPAEESAATVDCGALDPGVWGVTAVHECSVCRGPFDASGPHQVWIARGVGADVLPLLVNACSAACVAGLPVPAGNHVDHPHTGGPDLRQPPPF